MELRIIFIRGVLCYLFIFLVTCVKCTFEKYFENFSEIWISRWKFFKINSIFEESLNLTRSTLSPLKAACRWYSSRLPDPMSSASYLLRLFLDFSPDRHNICAALRSRASSSRLASVRCMSLKSRTEKLWVWFYQLYIF